MKEIGKVTQVMRYPFKGMRGEQLSEALLTYSGIVGDRVWALVLKDGEPKFPWLAGKKFSDILLYEARFVSEIPTDRKYPDQNVFETVVTTPEGESFDARDERLLEILSKHSGKEASLRFSERGMHDARPISLVGNSTIAGLSQEVGESLDPLRFRMNFYVDWVDATPFFEDQLIGRTIRIGSEVVLKVLKKNARCVVINVDPSTGKKNPEVLKVVGREHQANVGIYAAVVEAGIVRPHDVVTLID